MNVQFGLFVAKQQTQPSTTESYMGRIQELKWVTYSPTLKKKYMGPIMYNISNLQVVISNSGTLCKTYHASKSSLIIYPFLFILLSCYTAGFCYLLVSKDALFSGFLRNSGFFSIQRKLSCFFSSHRNISGPGLSNPIAADLPTSVKPTGCWGITRSGCPFFFHSRQSHSCQCSGIPLAIFCLWTGY